VELYQVRYFLALSETLNFTRAAERCHVTQPALTRAIQKLEEELGGQLIRRERNLSHLTDFGRLMRPHLEQIVTDTATARSTAKSFLTMENAAVKLGVMCTIGPLRSLGFLAAFHEAHASLEVTLVEAVPKRLSELLMLGEVDVAIMAQPAPFEERFDPTTLYHENFVVALPPGHRLELQNEVSFTDLDGESYLSRLNCEYYDYLRETRMAVGVNFRDAYRSEREDWIQMMVMAGFGVCFVPEYSPLLPGIQLRRLTGPEVVREVCLVTVAGRRLSPAVLTFVKAARGHSWQD
jgi:DNA-binding transcriptional LysR family regulator